MFKKLFAPASDSFLTSLGLLVLRVWLGATLLLNHGIGKAKGFSEMSGGFPDPLHVGHATSLGLVIFAEVIAAALLALGLVTRFAALIIAVNMAVAFVYAHHMSLSGSHSGELAFIYLGGCVALLLAGGGAISLDKKVFTGGGKKRDSAK